MQVSDQAAEDLAISGRHVGTHGLDNMAGEVGIEAAGWCGRGAVCETVGDTVGRHGERRMKMQSTEMLQLAKGQAKSSEVATAVLWSWRQTSQSWKSEK